MSKENTSTTGGKDEETFKYSALLEEEKIDGEISVKGAESLTNQELLAVILSGDMGALNAVNLLNTFDGNLIHLFCASINQLMETEGIGFPETYKIKAVLELTKRIAAYCEEDHPKIASKAPLEEVFYLHKKVYIIGIVKEYNGSPEIRARILLLVNEGRTEIEIKDILGISRATVSNIKKRYREEGLQSALADKERPGQPKKIH